MKPGWPVMADLREKDGPWGDAANHDADGFNVLHADGAVNWIPISNEPNLSDITDTSYTTGDPLTSVSMNPTWHRDAFLRR